MGLKVLEIPSSPGEGMNLDVLSYAIKHTPVHACIVIANFNNPLGSLMPEGKKRELVALLAKHEIPLIEDDVYGDLFYGPARPTSTKAYDEKGLVLYCSSFSKTLAPGYRIGWIVPGRFQQKVEDLKALLNISTATPTQLAIAEFLANGGYDHHLRKVRRIYARQIAQVREAIFRYFPKGTRVSRPEGGFVLWVEMPEGFDSLRFHEEALREGISIAPGTVFTTGDKFGNCIRVNTAFWSERIEQALETLGGIAEGMVNSVDDESIIDTCLS
jgi:DNA-binding transcriptional MocR family regulator